MRYLPLVLTVAAGIATLAAGTAIADDSDLEAAIQPLTVVDGREITVTATRSRRDPFELPQSIAIFSREDVQTNGSFVALQAISRRDAAIWYDERTTSTTDPIIPRLRRLQPAHARGRQHAVHALGRGRVRRRRHVREDRP